MLSQSSYQSSCKKVTQTNADIINLFVSELGCQSYRQVVSQSNLNIINHVFSHPGYEAYCKVMEILSIIYIYCHKVLIGHAVSCYVIMQPIKKRG